MYNTRPLQLGALWIFFMSTLHAEPLPMNIQAENTLETPLPCKSNEFEKNNYPWPNDCWPCADSCETCTMSFILGFKSIEYCTKCKDDSTLTWWWDIWPFTGHYYCLPKCTAPAVWDSNENAKNC